MTDLVLEDATSLDLIAELRESERFQDLSLMVSGKAGKEEIAEAGATRSKETEDLPVSMANDRFRIAGFSAPV